MAHRRLGILVRGSPRRGSGWYGRLGSSVLLGDFLRVVGSRTSVEVDQWLNGDLCLDVAFLLCLLQLLNLGVVGGNVGVVVLGVVKLHDLAGDGRLKRTIVVLFLIISTSSLYHIHVLFVPLT